MSKNIWVLYKLVLIASLLIFGLYTKNEWVQEENRQKQQLENQANFTASGLRTLLEREESIIDLIVASFIKRPSDIDFLKSITVMNDSEQVRYLVANTDDQQLTGDYSLPPGTLNATISKHLAAQHDKAQALIIGNSYFDPNHQTTVLPISRAIVDDNRMVIAVVVAAIQLERTHLFRQQRLAADQIETRLVSEDNRILMIASEMFNKMPVAKKIEDFQHRYTAVNADEAKQYLADSSGISLQDLKASETAHSAFFRLRLSSLLSNNRLNDNHWQKTRIYAAHYNRQYQVWTVVSSHIGSMLSDFIRSRLLNAAGLLLILLLLLNMTRRITESERSKHLELVHQATHDPLTDLPNRQYLRQLGKQFIEDSEHYSLLFIDLDKFKDVNDTYGHETGDQILKRVARRLQSFERNNVKIFRESGDEFIMLSKDDDVTVASQYARSIIDELTLPHRIYDAELVIGASIGIASYPENGNNIEELIRCADIAMYDAKQYRNNFRVFDDEIKQHHTQRVHIEQNLGKAFKNREIFMVYQPQFNQDGDLHGVEALARWKDKDGHFYPPDVFIAVAENCGQMPALGRYIMDSVFSDMKCIYRQCGVHFQVSINVSLAQLVMPDFVQNTFEAIEASPLSPEQLTLELTESSLIDNLALVQSVFEQIRAQGIKLSLDDFGTGFSSLSLLGQLPIQELKIDKSFVDDITNEEKAVQMMRNIVSIGKNYNMAVLAEGVETAEQLKVLLNNSCDFFQGYFYAKPMDKNTLINFLKENRQNNDTPKNITPKTDN